MPNINDKNVVNNDLMSGMSKKGPRMSRYFLSTYIDISTKVLSIMRLGLKCLCDNINNYVGNVEVLPLLTLLSMSQGSFLVFSKFSKTFLVPRFCLTARQTDRQTYFSALYNSYQNKSCSDCQQGCQKDRKTDRQTD